MTAFIKGLPPILAVEIGRRSYPRHNRPTFKRWRSWCGNRAPVAQAEAA